MKGYTLGRNEDNMSRGDIKNLDNIWDIDDNGDYIY